MSIKNIKDWTYVASLALKQKKNIVSINNNTFEFIIYKLRGKDLGSMTIWNTETKHAFHISRMSINKTINSEIITASEENNTQDSAPLKNLIFSKSSKPFI